MKTTVQTYCPQCKSRCGVICEIQDGHLTGIRKDPDHPNAVNLCPKGLAAPELVYHPERLRHPLKRTRPKTDPDPGWQRISWDAALNEIAERLQTCKTTCGPESVFFGQGASGGTPANDYRDWVTRLALAFGSPNGGLGTTHICNWHKDSGSKFTYGTPIPTPDFENARTILLWGHNPFATWRRHLEEINRARRRGAKIIIIDPRRSETWHKGDLWLAVRPGSDGALALGMLHVMIAEGLYDRDFTVNWTNAPFLVRTDTGKFLRTADLPGGFPGHHYLAWDPDRQGPRAYDPAVRQGWQSALPALQGSFTVALQDGRQVTCKTVFELLTELVATYPPEKVQEITWVAADLIREATRLFTGNGPACYYSYNGLEQHTNAMQTGRAVNIFFALTGNFDAPGGNVLFPRVKTNPAHGKDRLRPAKPPLGKHARPLGPDNVQARDFYEAVLTGKPYPAKALMAFGGNVLMSNGDTERGRKALEQLDFFVQVDYFETPSARMADIVLPAASPWEAFLLKTTFEGGPRTSTYLQLMDRAVAPFYEARGDIDIVFDLAVRLGLAENFWDGDIEAAFNYQLAPAGITVEDLRKHPGGLFVPAPVTYQKYREPAGDGRLRGFQTPCGKMEIYAETFLENGFPALPAYVEPMMSPVSRPDVAARFPLVLTNKKLLSYCHGQHRALPGLRKIDPDPYVEIHPDTAAELQIREGAWVALETPFNRIRVKARLTTGIHPRVVCTQHGWWQGCSALNLAGFDPFSDAGANVNRTIVNDLADPITGSVSHKSMLCALHPVAPS
ncbi:MAG: molybdopterin-dependent oxidoreductase [Desulfobacterales bacterium]|nr:molybdopterin-dependent oxidoreductase [Desulfobacterales bacterium]